jgi:type II secretory pathway pseudopilin PulG
VKPRGVTLLETVLSLGLFSLLSIVLFATFKLGNDLWRSSDSRSEGLGRLQTATQRFEKDLNNSSAGQIRSKRVPSPGNGDVIWALSPLDPTESDPQKEQYRRDPNGKPEWQRNIVFYLIRPSNHDSVVGKPCAVDSNTEGDAVCPHKVLVRKVINGSDSPEELLSSSQIDQYLTAPNGFDVSSFSGEPGLEEARVIGSNILWFKAVDHVQGDSLLKIDLKAVSLKEAQRQISIGQQPIERFLLAQYMTLVPGVRSTP